MIKVYIFLVYIELTETTIKGRLVVSSSIRTIHLKIFIVDFCKTEDKDDLLQFA